MGFVWWQEAKGVRRYVSQRLLGLLRQYISVFEDVGFRVRLPGLDSH